MSLKWQSWVILSTHLLWFVILIHEMAVFWSMRRKMKIHARSPVLALISGATGMVLQATVMVQQILNEEGSDAFPCVVLLYLNAPTISFYAAPYLLRGLRVVIISDKVWRAKYSMMLSRQNVMPFIAILFVVLLVICFILHQRVPELYGPNPTAKCFILADWWFWGPVCLSCAGLSSKLFMELARVKDSINMSKEIMIVAITWVVHAGPYFTLLVLHHFEVVESPLAQNYTISTCTVLTSISTFFVEPRRHKGELPCLKQCMKQKKKKVAVVMDEPHIAKWREKWDNSKVIMANPILDAAFEKHVQDYLCSESYDFLKVLDTYDVQVGELTPEELFAKFRSIVDMYILAGSELEVNIETAMRNKVLKIGEKDAFVAAENEVRRDIFIPSGVEIRKMLDENLIKSFMGTPHFLNACQKVEEQEEAGTEESASASTMVQVVKGKRNTLMAMGGFDGQVEQGLEGARAALGEQEKHQQQPDSG